MAERFQNLTNESFDARPDSCGFIQVGVVRQIEKHTILYLHADKMGEHYEPSINIYSYGKPIVPMNDPYCFDLTKEAGILLCIRGLKFSTSGQPLNFLVEIYQAKKQPDLRIVK